MENLSVLLFSEFPEILIYDKMRIRQSLKTYGKIDSLENEIRIPKSLKTYGKMDNLENNKNIIRKYLKNPPKSWIKVFSEEGISSTPSIDQVLSLLKKTAGGNESLEDENISENPNDFIPPSTVRDEAMKGIRLSYDFNYPSYRGIGLARAIQLATQPTIRKRSIERMNAFFSRNYRYQNLSGFNNDNNPSKSYLAWLNWGGTSGMNWAKSLN